MKLKLKARSWHTWVSVAFALPILIVGSTAIFIAHYRSLALEDVIVAAGWLPGYRNRDAETTGIEPSAVLVASNGMILVGTQGGLYRLEAGRLAPVADFPAVAVRGLAEGSFGLVAAAKSGVWLRRNGPWERAIEGEAWNVVSRGEGGVVVAVKGRGVLFSRDGLVWQADEEINGALRRLAGDSAARPITMGKLVMDLHSGQAFFGKAGKWLWIDLIGLTICSLVLTGVYMWWRAERRKASVGKN